MCMYIYALEVGLAQMVKRCDEIMRGSKSSNAVKVKEKKYLPIKKMCMYI